MGKKQERGSWSGCFREEAGIEQGPQDKENEVEKGQRGTGRNEHGTLGTADSRALCGIVGLIVGHLGEIKPRAPTRSLEERLKDGGPSGRDREPGGGRLARTLRTRLRTSPSPLIPGGYNINLNDMEPNERARNRMQ